MSLPPDRPAGGDRPGGDPFAPVWDVQGPWGAGQGGPAGPTGRPVRRRRPFVTAVALVVALAMVLATGAALFSAWSRSDGGSGGAVSSLLDGVERSESVMVAFQAGLERARSPEAVTDVADAALPQLVRARSDVGRLRLDSSSISKARDKYLAHADAWLAAMRSVSQGRGVENTPQINRTFAEACGAMRDVARDEGTAGDSRRVERICAEPEGPGTGPGDSIRA